MSQHPAPVKALEKKIKTLEKKEKAERKQKMDSYDARELLRHAKAHQALDAVSEGEGNAEVMDILNTDSSDPQPEAF